MNARLTATTEKTDAQSVSQKAERIINKFMTQKEINTIFDIDAQQYKNQVYAVYWTLHFKFGFTAEQLREFSKEYTDNFPDIDTHPAYLLADVPQRAELENSLGITVEELENVG